MAGKRAGGARKLRKPGGAGGREHEICDAAIPFTLASGLPYFSPAPPGVDGLRYSDGSFGIGSELGSLELAT
jgi:hypothetical protein